MISESTIESTVKALFDNISFTDEPAGLYDPLRYMMAIGGKRIRPRLALTTFSLYRDEFEDGILDAAEALEVFHSFTLIHDDIMDNASKRRGVDTVWKKWDNNTAILCGDVMNIDSYRRLAKVSPKALPKVLELFNAMAAGVCEGQQYDMEFENTSRVSMEEYIRMIGLKTSCLIACAAQIGAVIGGASEKDSELLYKFGYDLGLAFQITDDYLDTFGDEKVFGKAIGGDILQDKKTWLLIRAMELDHEAVSQAIALPGGNQEQAAAKIEAVTALYRKLGVQEQAKEAIKAYQASAEAYVAELGLSRLKSEILLRYAASLAGRVK